MKLCANNLHLSFNDENIIKDLSFELNDGEYAYVDGYSGAGKTTVLNIVAGLLKPESGTVLIDNTDIAEIDNYRKNTVGYMPCGNVLLEALTVDENIELVSKITKAKKAEYYEKLKIGHIKKKHPSELSSGEYKRAVFLRTLSQDTSFLLLDEPTSNLDKTSAEIIAAEILSLKGKKGILVATHDDRLKVGTKICV